jgi:hypothetical protein
MQYFDDSKIRELILTEVQRINSIDRWQFLKKQNETDTVGNISNASEPD